MGLENFGAFMAKAADALETVFPAVLVMDSVSYVVASSGALERESAADDGWAEDFTARVRLKKAAFATEPEKGKVVTLDGVSLRIVSVSSRAWDVCWHIELEPEVVR